MSTRFFTLSIAFGIAAMSITSNAAAAGKADFNGEGFANGTISIPFKDAGVADAGTVQTLYSASAAWQHAHGDSANTGFARVDTDPADSHNPFNQLGPLAPGANPVIGPDGTLYIGNLAGELRAFHADGTPYWTRQLNSEHGGIFAAPVVGADGSIYVVSSNHDTDLKRNDSFLHKFSAGGGWFFWRPFPEHDGYLSGTPADGGATTAPPNIWRANGTEAIMVPALYQGIAGKYLRLLAFSTSGAVLGDIMVWQDPSPETTGGSDIPAWLPFCVAGTFWNGQIWICLIAAGAYGGFSNSVSSDPFPLAEAGIPMPGVAIRQDPQGGAPFVVMSAKQDKVTYAFSPQTGFSEVNRSTHTLRTFTTPPVVQGNGTTATGTLDGYLTFTDANFGQLLAAGGLGTLTAAPTRLADGRLVVISREGRISLLSGSQVTWQSQLMGESIASAAASCTHLFVSTTDEFVTFDTKTMLPVAKLPWIGGGLAAPVIAPSGYVYAIASDSLFVFPPPRFGDVLATTACDQLAPPSISPGGWIVEDVLPPQPVENYREPGPVWQPGSGGNLIQQN